MSTIKCSVNVWEIKLFYVDQLTEDVHTVAACTVLDVATTEVASVTKGFSMVINFSFHWNNFDGD